MTEDLWPWFLTIAIILAVVALACLIYLTADDERSNDDKPDHPT